MCVDVTHELAHSSKVTALLAWRTYTLWVENQCIRIGVCIHSHTVCSYETACFAAEEAFSLFLFGFMNTLR